jgi:uncharacterized membrane protein YbhN (UPF0104 family)
MVGESVTKRVRRWFPVIRIAASGLMLVVLIRHIPHLRSVIPVWSASTVAWLAGALAFTLLGIVLSAVRWQRVLVAMDLPARLSTLVNAALAGQFVSNFLPSTIGGDAIRVTRLSATNGETPATFASVVLDRMSGWLILPVLCLAGLMINPTLFHLGRATSAAVTLSVITLVALVAVLAVAASPRLGGRLAGHATWLRFAGAVHLGLDRIRRRPAAAAGVLVTGFLYQLAVVAAAILGARALGIQVGPTALLAFIPAVAIVQVVPFTVGGLGVREGALILFLTPLGVPTSQAIALGLLVYVMHLVASLLGAPAFAVGNRAARAVA